MPLPFQKEELFLFDTLSALHTEVLIFKLLPYALEPLLYAITGWKA